MLFPQKAMSKQTKINPRRMTTATTASQTTDSTAAEAEAESLPTMNTTALIREVTQNLSDTMEMKLSKFTEILEKISGTLENQSKRIAETEQRVSEVEDVVSGLEGRLAEAEKKIKVLAANTEVMENRSRRDNIRVLNLKEGTEGKRPVQFFETWLPTVLGLEASPSAKSRISTGHIEV